MFARICFALTLALTGLSLTPSESRAGDCEPYETTCSGKCVELSRHRDHCGACGVRCDDGYTCDQGRCRIKCPDSQLVCGSICVTPTSNAEHCGGCGNRCADGSYCLLGQCKTFASALTNWCPTGLTMCSGKCRDTYADRANCGGCGRTCGASEVCERGRCLGICTDTQKTLAPRRQ